MSIFSFLKRKPGPAPVVQPVVSGNNDSRASISIKGDEAQIEEIRKGLAFIRDRQRLRNQPDAVLYLIRKYREHVERLLRDEGIVTIKRAKQPQEIVSKQSATLPPRPPIGLAGKDAIQRRIEVCNRAITQIDNEGYSWALRKQWTETLEALDRLMILLDSGLSLENRVSHGVLVDGKHYYRLGKGQAKMLGNTHFVPMDVHTFIATVGAAA